MRGVRKAGQAWSRAHGRLHPLPLSSRILLAGVVVAVLSTGAFLPTLQSADDARRADAAQDRAERTRTAAATVLRHVLDLETGTRGFLLTHDDRFLEPWRRARRRLPPDLEALERASAKRKDTASIASSIARRARGYLRRFNEPLVSRAVDDLAGARRIVASGEGKRRVDALRADEARLVRVVTRESDRRRDNQVAAERTALIFGGAGLAISLVLIAVFVAYLRRAITTPLERLTAGTDALAGGTLTARVQGGGPPEFAALAESFNAMAASLQSSRGRLESFNRELVEARREAEQANAAKSEFLSRMSHELRTPLNSIIGFSQLLEMEDLPEDQRDSVERVLKAGRHLLGLIDEVLDISRIEAGDMSVSPEPVDAGVAVREAVELIRPLAAERSITMDASATDTEHYVIADSQRLRQILLNLLSNAVKYNSEAGSIRIAFEPRAERLAIRVSDTGRGLTPAQIDRLFVPFERLGAEGGEVEGTGLGLALSRRLAEAMGATLEVSSERGVGSTFTLELPLADDPNGTDRDPPAQPRSERVPGGGAATVLYIEDNPANLRLVERILATRPGTELLGAMLGSLGLELAEQHRPDLVILDLHLPDLGGDEVLRRLKASPRTEGVPVIILSADATDRQIQRLLEEGAAAYLTKPLDVTSFLDAVAEALDGGSA